MKKIFAIAAALCWALSSGAQTTPVTGTFLNFFWQDERNNYTNQRNVDQTDPELWAAKLEEMHAIGVDYLVLMAVANEGKSIYPSQFMEHLYPENRKCPIDAVMDKADELGMHVIMSCGWARNQLDNLADPYVVETQRKIMEELAALYGERSSFYGWYLPVEGCMIPYLPDKGIEGCNKVAARARELTPGAKVMISPYGIFKGEFDNPKFAEQIYKLDVDIIAYQDEIGCVRETFPMRNMKNHFKLLRQIHDKCNIELWANVESFTWDRPTNNWYSTLIPAAFGRFLSQIVGVSQAGVERIISFTMAGIFDMPGSEHPLGQPVLSAQAYGNYASWLAGDRHWKLLESFLSEDDCADEDPSDARWNHYDGTMEYVVDLGKKQDVTSVAGHFLSYRAGEISVPQSFEVLVSCDGKKFKHVTTVAHVDWANNLHDCWSDVVFADNLNIKARYVKVVAVCESGSIYCSKIVCNK